MQELKEGRCSKCNHIILIENINGLYRIEWERELKTGKLMHHSLNCERYQEQIARTKEQIKNMPKIFKDELTNETVYMDCHIDVYDI